MFRTDPKGTREPISCILIVHFIVMGPIINFNMAMDFSINKFDLSSFSLSDIYVASFCGLRDKLNTFTLRKRCSNWKL